MLAGRRIAWAQGWQAIKMCPEGLEAVAAAAAGRDHLLRMGESCAGALVAQHEKAWTLEAQQGALRTIRRHVQVSATKHLHNRDAEGVHNKLRVLRYLHDFEDRLELMHNGSGEDLDGQLDVWSALEQFCRPRSLTQGSVELVRFEEHVPPELRVLCALLSPVGMPVGSILAWLTLQSPSAFCRLHLRRVVGPRVAPCRVRLDKEYAIEPSNLSLQALDDATNTKSGIYELVKAAAQAPPGEAV
mmetsp:Transcript_46505/g.92128  ORF Transcript_46505/g.92128 Transcript_46505/m.92128 type:complete len:244 (+) Transcript_46505:40-771(+)|eukprot:CAMPEP_0170441606 /NCGR_PEP_ID=MMETSP0117_2-20130122/46984_1 /TAXON_ID=400756 /ORGANISM="Durinskia baltica, Strain CSIRO CS-38" /LENGTH=243 /DNA_ID=CAMNT_0010702159 /DNA_START=30 /DNA_END=761 /DNA_ORIENTATION=-